MIYVYDELSERMVPKWEMLARQSNRPNNFNPDLGCPHIISDVMDHVKSMLDGEMYDSKSHLRQTYKQAGMTELGNDSSIMDPKPFKRPPPDKAGIEEAVGRAWSAVDLVTPG